MISWHEIECPYCHAWQRAHDEAVQEDGHTDHVNLNSVTHIWRVEYAPRLCPACSLPAGYGATFRMREVELKSYVRDTAEDVVQSMLRDPSVLASAIMSLHPDLRAQVHVLFDALEAGGTMPPTEG